MSKEFSKEIRSNVTSDGNIEISIASVEKPVPAENEVLIKVEASPINPSDLGLLISFAADLDSLEVSGSGDETVAKMKVHPGLMKAMTPRLDQSMKVGNEGGGVVEAAGARCSALNWENGWCCGWCNVCSILLRAGLAVAWSWMTVQRSALEVSLFFC